MVIHRLIFLTALLFFPLFVLEADAAHKNNINVTVDIENSQIAGTSTVGVTAGEKLSLHKGRLDIINIVQNGNPVSYSEHDGIIEIIPETTGTVEINFSGVYRQTLIERDIGIADSVIDERGVSLTGTWYPETGGLSYYELTVTLPEGYEAVSEAEKIRKEVKDGRVEFHFTFPHPVDGLNLVASDRYKVAADHYGDVEIYAYFFEEDSGLAKTYIDYTKKYLELYEGLIGEYPYQRFSIVENFLPTGYSMPTFTLLGSSVVKLPFIVETSLGHEILHQWFGNLVYVDYTGGNWAEGLTTYLSDHLYREQKDEGPQYRKQVLIDFMSYVSVEEDMPLKLFQGRSGPATRSIGYGKTAMVFHMLLNLTGKEMFYDSLKDFIQKNRFKRASWEDIRKSFEGINQRDLTWFFSQWIEKEGLPGLKPEGIEITQKGKTYNLHFHLNHTRTFYWLSLPVTIYMRDSVKLDMLTIDKEENSFDFTLPERPHRIVLDEDYDIARYLHEDEIPPVVAKLLGEKKVVVVLPASDEDRYQGVIEYFKKRGAAVTGMKEMNETDMVSSSVVVLGKDNPLSARLYGGMTIGEAGFSIIVKKHPWNSNRVVAVINGESKEEVDAAFRKLRHYGKYSRLLFEHGRNIEKTIEESQRGIVLEAESETPVIDMSAIKTLSSIIKGVADKKIVYVGEVHNLFAHHAVQLEVISGLYRHNRKLAIGMEMFQQPFQETLDAYIAGNITEAEFLKNSEYFTRWGFDYNLYKPVLDFARAEKVPVVALNLQREIVNKVSAGGIDSLTDEEKEVIPDGLDFSDAEYRGRLEEIFNMHGNSRERKFDYFYQAQILWDETMSRSVDEYLRKNPDYQIVVLAGQGHLRYGSGIPKRTYRRNGYDYAVVLIDDEIAPGIADYIAFPRPVEGVAAPRLMVFLQDKEGVMVVTGFPDDSVAKKAGIRLGDKIVSMDGEEINSIDDIKIQLTSRKKGDIIRVTVLRKWFFVDKGFEIEVEL